MKCIIKGCKKESTIKYGDTLTFCGYRHAFRWFKKMLVPVNQHIHKPITDTGCIKCQAMYDLYSFCKG